MSQRRCLTPGLYRRFSSNVCWLASTYPCLRILERSSMGRVSHSSTHLHADKPLPPHPTMTAPATPMTKASRKAAPERKPSTGVRMAMAAHGYPPLHYASYATSSSTHRQRSRTSDARDTQNSLLETTTTTTNDGGASRRSRNSM
jgi:hypothetical protein